MLCLQTALIIVAWCVLQKLAHVEGKKRVESICRIQSVRQTTRYRHRPSATIVAMSNDCLSRSLQLNRLYDGQSSLAMSSTVDQLSSSSSPWPPARHLLLHAVTSTSSSNSLSACFVAALLLQLLDAVSHFTHRPFTDHPITKDSGPARDLPAVDSASNSGSR